MKQILTNASVQVIENLTGIALGNGFTLPEGCNRKDWATKNLKPNLDQDEYMTNFLQSLLEIEKIRDYFVTQLRRTLKPQLYGIERVWKQTQSEAIEAIIYALENWYTRPLVEIPTGVGKSMIWGAIARAFYDTLRMFGVEDMFEIVIFTSRIHIGEQMITRTKNTSVDLEDDDAPLELGDVKMWLPQLAPSDFRILSGKSNSLKEKTKNAKVTIACYQGLNEQTLYSVFEKKSGLILLDESHRVTDRVRIMLENKMHTGFFIGGSGTTKGPRRNNPFVFFEAMKPEKENDIDVLYKERLAYHASIGNCVLRRELKRLRYVNTKTSIDLSSIDSSTGDIPQQQAAKLIAKNVPAMNHILEELFLGEQEVLRVAGSKLPIERKWLVFVDRVAIADELAQFCNEELLPQIQKKYGANTPFIASYVSGPQSKTRTGMSHTVFNERMVKFHNGDITVLFSSEKLGEGSDVPNVNGILSFRAYGRPSVWKFIQEVGRGTRYFENDDLLVVDGVFKSSRHRLASLTSEFGITSYLSGGLIAGYQGEREAETKVFALLQQGYSWKEVWSELSDEEKVLVPFVQKFLIESVSVGPEVQDFHREIDIKSIEFVEDDIVDLKKLLNIAKVIEILKENDITDYWSLKYDSKSEKLEKISFSGFKVYIIFSTILGNQSGTITHKDIDDFAKKIGWYPSEEEKIAYYKNEFQKHGIIDYWTLLAFPIYKMARANFGLLRKGYHFFRTILGGTTELNPDSYKKVAHVIGWIPKESERMQKFKHEFAKNSIKSYGDLFKKQMTELKQLNFGEFGSGGAFFSIITGDASPLTIQKVENVSRYMGWSPIEYCREEFKKHGIVDFLTLLNFGRSKFANTKFDGITGVMMSNIIFGAFSNDSVNLKRMEDINFEELSEKLGWSLNLEQKKGLVIQLLAKEKIIDHWSLVRIRPDYFRSKKFEPIGGGFKLLGFILNKTFKHVLRSSLEELSLFLGWSLSDEEKIKLYKVELSKNNVFNYEDLFSIKTADFKAMSFGDFGKGAAFLAEVLNLKKSKVSKGEIKQLGQKIFPLEIK